MAPRRRDRTAEQATIRAAIDRLLAGTPLRSSSGKLTTSALIDETGLRRDVVYEHSDLIDEFKARIKAQRSTPAAFQQLTDQNVTLAAELATTKQQLAAEQATASALRKALAELSLELHQALEELADLSGVIPLHRPGRDGPP